MQRFQAPSALRAWLRSAPRPVALVPTMGGLHAGHGSLIDEARRGSATVVVSIFVNPIQFNQQSDYERYPRPLEADLAFCEARGVDVVFAPALEDMYPQAQTVVVEPGPVASAMEGRFRPGHFRGVATVVMKLLQIVQPERAWFGEKDAQQLAVIRRMVAELNVPVEIAAAPTVREASGLALSTRNQLLSAAENEQAPRIYQALCAAARLVEEGQRDAETVRSAGLAVLGDLRIDYFEIADEMTMEPVARITGPVRIATAVSIGNTRLIDNVKCSPPSGRL